MNLAIFFLSITPAALILLVLFNRQSKVFQKDFGIYLVKLFLCCFITMRIALFVNTYMFNNTDLNFSILDENLMFYTAFAGIGFNEEMAKLIPILFLLYISDRWKNKTDVFFSCLFTGAFFAAFENLFVPNYNSYLGSLLLRSFIAVPAHLSFACIMGYFIYLALKCSTKEDYLRDKFKSSLIGWSLQFILFFKIAFYFYQNQSSEFVFGSWILCGCVIVLIFLMLEVYLNLINREKFNWLFGWNMRLSYLLMALIVPAMLHGLHDWGCSRFTGQHLLLFYICLFSTYLTIIVFAYFILNKQVKVNVNTNNIDSNARVVS